MLLHLRYPSAGISEEAAPGLPEDESRYLHGQSESVETEQPVSSHSILETGNLQITSEEVAGNTLSFFL